MYCHQILVPIQFGCPLTEQTGPFGVWHFCDRRSRILSAVPETLYIIWKTGLPLLCTPKIAPASQNREEDKCLLENERPVLLIHSEMRAFEEIRVLHFLVGKTYRSLTHSRINYLGRPNIMLQTLLIFMFLFFKRGALLVYKYVDIKGKNNESLNYLRFAPSEAID